MCVRAVWQRRIGTLTGSGTDSHAGFISINRHRHPNNYIFQIPDDITQLHLILLSRLSCLGNFRVTGSFRFLLLHILEVCNVPKAFVNLNPMDLSNVPKVWANFVYDCRIRGIFR